MLAYFETVRNGLVPVRITKMVRLPHGGLDITFVVTGSRPGYRRGYCTGSNGLHVIPRHAVRWRKYSTSIMPYSWTDEATKSGFTIEEGVSDS